MGFLQLIRNWCTTQTNDPPKGYLPMRWVDQKVIQMKREAQHG